MGCSPRGRRVLDTTEQLRLGAEGHEAVGWPWATVSACGSRRLLVLYVQERQSRVRAGSLTAFCVSLLC